MQMVILLGDRSHDGKRRNVSYFYLVQYANNIYNDKIYSQELKNGKKGYI